MKKKLIYQTILQVFLSFWASYSLFQSVKTYSPQWFILFLLLIAPALMIQKYKIKEHNQNEIFTFIKYIYFFLNENAQKNLVERSQSKHLSDILHLYYVYDYLSHQGNLQVYWIKAKRNDLVIFDKEIIYYVKYFHNQYRKLILNEYEKEKTAFLYEISNNDKLKQLTNYFILLENEISNNNLLDKVETVLARSSEDEINQPSEHIKLFIEQNLINKKNIV